MELKGSTGDGVHFQSAPAVKLDTWRGSSTLLFEGGLWKLGDMCWGVEITLNVISIVALTAYGLERVLRPISWSG
jgi:hypothetical protein